MDTTALVGFNFTAKTDEMISFVREHPEYAEHVARLMTVSAEHVQSCQYNLKIAAHELGVFADLFGRLDQRVNFLIFWMKMTRQPLPLALCCARTDAIAFRLAYQTAVAYLRQAGDPHG